MGDSPSPIFGMIAVGFMNLAPAVFLIVCSVLLMLSLWLARQTWRSVRIIHGTTLTPLDDMRAQQRGLVKLRGLADAPAPPGMSPPGIVYQEITSSRRSGGGYSRSTLRSSGWVLLAQGDNSCALELSRAKVIPTANEVTHEFLQRENWGSNGIINRGDTVFALGRLVTGPPKGKDAPAASCVLRPVSGVLVFSGQREGSVQFTYVVYALIQFALAALTTVLLIWGALIHLGSYPPGERGSLFTFREALRTTPWQAESGPGHPGWSAPADSLPSP